MRIIFIIFIFSVSLFPIKAQDGIIVGGVYPPKTQEAPIWAKDLQSTNPNVFAIDSAYEAYFKSHPYKKNLWTKYYRRWRKRVASYIQADGSLLKPDQIDQYRTIVEKKSKLIPEQDANWTNIGPKTTHWLTQDVSTGDPCPWQVNIYAFEIAPSDPNILYLVTETASFFRSSDKGLTWQIAGTGYMLASEAIAIHPTDPNTVILGTDGVVRRTNDGGKTWTNIYSNSGLWCYRIAYNPTDPNIILMATNKGTIRSSNGGSSWQIIQPDICEDLEFSPANANIVYILKQNTSSNFYECWKSTNAGVSFTAKTIGWPTGLTGGDGRLAVTAADPARVYGVLLTSGGPRIVRSNNSGDSWNVTASGSTTALGMDNGQGYYDLDIVASSTNANNIIVATTTAFRSTDGGINFTNVGGYSGPFPIHPDIQAMRNIGNDTYIATDGGLSYSNDFFNAYSEPRSNGISSTDLWGFDSGWNEDVLVGGRYHNGNTAWYESYPAGYFLRMGGAEAATGYVNPIKNRQTYFSDIGGYEIPDKYDGKVVNLPISKWPNESYYYMEYSEMTWDPTCWNIVYIGNGPSLWKSTNNGVGFDPIFTSTDQGAVIEHIEIARTNPKVIYITQRSNDLGEGKIWKTTNGGITWNQLADLPTTKGQRRVMTISLSGENENELWVALAYSVNGKKVFYSPNGGNTWVNWTSSKLDGFNLTDMVHQLGTDGGVYVAGTDGHLFYRNKSMSDWVDFSTGLPVNHNSRALKPFYRDKKIRTGSNVGFWESPLFEDSKLLAQPVVDKLSSSCSRDTFYFDDYSVLNYDGAQSWSWSFPGAQTVIGADTRTPKVVYGSSGSYDVSLTVTNNSGINSRTIQKMVSVLPSECGIDTIAGKCLKISGDYKIVSIPKIDRLKNATSATFMCWIRLADQQEWFTQLISNWSSNAQFGFGFAFQGYIPTVNLTFSWNNVPYWLTSPFNLELNKWIHVAMTVEPTKVTLYKDGIPWVYNGDFSNFDLSSTPFEIGGPVYGQGGTFNGEMEEFKIFKTALSQNQIREQMHLINKNPDDNQVLYYQFNESNPGLVYDKAGQSHGLNGTGQLITSNAVVASGVSDRITINTAGTTNFPKSGISLKFPTNGGTNLPNGEMVITRLYASPFGKPNTPNNTSSHYWVVENWGTNNSFTGLSDIGFYNSGIGNTGSKLYSRPVFEYNSNSWLTKNNSGTQINGGQAGDISFINNNLINGASQLIIAGEKTPVIVNAGQDQSVCIGTPVVLHGTGGVKYDWYDMLGNSVGSGNQITVNPTQSIQYILKVTDVNGNQGSDTVAINIWPLPIANAGSDQAVCLGKTIQLNASGGLTYSWNPANLLNNANIQDPIASPVINTNFIVEVTDLNGCKAKDTVQIIVNTNPDILLLDLNLNAGENAMTNISGSYQINWSNGNSGPIFTTALAGKYSVTITNTDGCTQVVEFNVLLDSTSLPNIYMVQNALLGLQQINNSDAYQWYLDGVLVNGATAQTIVPPGEGFYTTYVHYANGFSAITPPFYYKKTIVAEQNGIRLKYYPNPVKKLLYFSFENPNEYMLDGLNCKIFNSLGKLVFSQVLNKEATIDISSLSNGTYYFKLGNEDLNFSGTIQVIK